ncbi:MAG: glycosyltransferase [Sedimentisphaerales bacterium]
MDQRIKVLHFIGSMERGGAESWLMSLLRKADKSKLQMDFCVVQNKEGIYANEIKSLGSTIHICPVKNFLSFDRRLAILFDKTKYDAVHSHLWDFSGQILKIAYKKNIPIRIAHSHNTQSKHKKTLYRRSYSILMRHHILKYSTNCLGCSSEASAALFGKNWEQNPKCRVLYCSTDTDLFAMNKRGSLKKSDLFINDETCVIGNVGNLRTQKNHTFFMDIAAEFIKIRPNSLFFIAGEGELRTQLEQKAKEIGISDKINFAGVRQDVPNLMTDIFDAFLFPSLYEGMPLTLIESACAGLRCVCSDTITKEATDVNPELFDRLGLDVPARQWAKVLYDSLDKPKVDKTKAFEIVENSHFSTKFSLKELTEIYSKNNR